MTTDFRALCAELLAAIQLYTQLNPAASDMSASELTEKLMDAMAATVAALAQPVAVSERLPGPDDCDEQGRCWLGGHQMGNGTPTWLLGYPAWAKRFPDVHRFWLPVHALPTPEATND